MRLIVRIGLGERRRAGQIERQLALRLGDGGLHIGGGGIDAFAQIELQREAGVALAAVAGDQFQTGNLHELALERRGDVVGHRLGRGTGIGDVHLMTG